MLSKLTSAFFAALILVLSVPANAGPSAPSNPEHFYDIPNEQRHWYDRNHPNA